MTPSTGSSLERKASRTKENGMHEGIEKLRQERPVTARHN